MNTAITFGHLFWFILIAGGIIGALAVIVAILSAIGRGYSM